MKTNVVTTGIVADAVNPLRNDAMEAAEKNIHELAAKWYAELEANGWDINKVAPRGDSWKMGRNEYRRVQNRHNLVSALTTRHPDHLYTPHSSIRIAYPAGVARLVRNAREAAAALYDAYVAKLSRKIGAGVTAATLNGNHVWSHSVLTVTREDGTVELWHTRCILNHSVYGLPFNQWPTRKVGGKKAR